ncbi:DUF1801 domain-containing protein [Aureibacter tunicatorum]|uniref:YdhG-like domain-containing protein n=1 Tax=Aureibacter tunicatorum TaxID=866807 RepID=A0AAE4BVL4_9BACT|nr:DUF1801 domain-containing protein [Aureibacter tunicatorum]MDR6241828.1 hypothetical protein [Aureibacter tunicatorum]BDD07075.1 hypothetical protein AUTU_45580 [Aureibacter tunicatorum]
MKHFTHISNPLVNDKFAQYPEHVQVKMNYLRRLVIEVAEESIEIDFLEETLKWGEPSFITKRGSTLRIDWKEKAPDQYAMYFQCTSRLVVTFQLIFGNLFQYEGKRAIVFPLNHNVPVNELKMCIKAALVYHDVKHLETFGI